MATADLFNREVRANKSPRNAFDMSYSTLFSSPAGMLLPSYVQEVKQGDKLKLGVSSLTRSAPVSTPAFMSFDEKTDFWFVPYELIWSDYENWRIAQTYRHRSNQLQGAGTQNYLPFTPFQSIGLFFSSFAQAPSDAFMVATPCSALRYLDLLGYSTPNYSLLYQYLRLTSHYDENATDKDFTNYPVTVLSVYYQSISKSAPCNYFRLAAFQCIYQHCYRNEEYEPLDPSYYNVDNLFDNNRWSNNVLTDSSPIPQQSEPYFLYYGGTVEFPQPFLNLRKLFTPRYKNWRKDVFTASKPETGFANGVTGLEIGSLNNATSTFGSGFYWPTKDTQRHFPSDGVYTDGSPSRYSPLSRVSVSSYDQDRIDWTYQTDGTGAANVVQRLYTSLSKDSSGNITHGLAFLYPQNIRNLMAQDKFSRSVIYADKDLSSQIKALFGENYDDPHTPRYLGSYSTNVTIDDIVATAAGDSGTGDAEGTSVLGELAGRIKQGDGNQDVFERSFDKDGVVIGVHYVMPRNNYDSYRLNKWNTKISRFDYFYPQFDGLGYQPVLTYERFIDGADLVENHTIQNSPYISTLYGFAPRYYEYKQRVNEVHSSFQNHQPDFSWTLTNNGIGVNAFTGSYPGAYKILPDITDRMFNVTWNGACVTDPFQHYYFYNATLVSDMEVYGTPSL